MYMYINTMFNHFIRSGKLLKSFKMIGLPTMFNFSLANFIMDVAGGPLNK